MSDGLLKAVITVSVLTGFLLGTLTSLIAVKMVLELL